MTNSAKILAPEQIDGLPADGRAVLTGAWMTVQARMQARPVSHGRNNLLSVEEQRRRTLDDEHARRDGIADALAQYRRVARLWGVDVDAAT